MFGSISKMIAGVAGSVFAKGDIGGVIEQAARSLNGNMSGMLKGLNMPASVPAAGFSVGMVDKAVYIAILNGAIQKAANAQNFNIETQINDLWTAFSAVRSKRPALENIQAQISGQRDVMQMLMQILKKQDEMAKQAISNMR